MSDDTKMTRREMLAKGMMYGGLTVAAAGSLHMAGEANEPYERLLDAEHAAAAGDQVAEAAISDTLEEFQEQNKWPAIITSVSAGIAGIGYILNRKVENTYDGPD